MKPFTEEAKEHYEERVVDDLAEGRSKKRIVKASEDHSFTTIKKNIEGLSDNTVKAIVTTASYFNQILSTPSIRVFSDESAQD